MKSTGTFLVKYRDDNMESELREVLTQAQVEELLHRLMTRIEQTGLIPDFTFSVEEMVE